VFGVMQTTQVLQLTKRDSLEQATRKLLEFTEHPQVIRWIQFPTALIVFLAHKDSPYSGAVYVYDRKLCAWLWVDFDDQNYGGYSASEFDLLVGQCHFLKLAESPSLLGRSGGWLIVPNQRPEALPT